MYTYPTDATGIFSTSTFISMANKKPDTGFGYAPEYKVNVFESNSGYEKRTLMLRRGKRTYNLSYTNITGLAKNAIETFYNQRGGTFESFYFDLSHIDETGTIIVKFDGPVNIKQVASSGANLLNKFYTVSFTLKETFD